ncbi:MAG: DUF222 domain-containing protein [Mycobacterium sp.]
MCWGIDGHTSLVAEVCTALAISRCRAAAQVKMAIALYTRLPRVLNVARSGLLDYRMLAAIVSRTELIQDPDVLERVDDRLAEKTPTWVRLSEPKIEARINAVLAAQDPEAVRIREQIRHDRQVGGCPNGDGHAQIWGNVDVAALATATTARPRHIPPPRSPPPHRSGPPHREAAPTTTPATRRTTRRAPPTRRLAQHATPTRNHPRRARRPTTQTAKRRAPARPRARRGKTSRKRCAARRPR